MKRRLTYLVLGLIFFIAGCAAMIPEQGRLEMAGRYGELERHMENIIKDPAKASNSGRRFNPVCLQLASTSLDRARRLSKSS